MWRKTEAFSGWIRMVLPMLLLLWAGCKDSEPSGSQPVDLDASTEDAGDLPADLSGDAVEPDLPEDQAPGDTVTDLPLDSDLQTEDPQGDQPVVDQDLPDAVEPDSPVGDVPPTDGPVEDTTPTDTSVEWDGGCLPNGSSCSEGSQCCSTICNADNICSVTLGVCDPAGEPCTSGATCCSGRCDREAGECLPGTGGCALETQPCETAADCCSYFCDDGFCSIEGVCAAINEACEVDADCCGNNCDGLTCLAATGCLPAGELCDPSTPTQCCSRTCAEFGGEYRCITGGLCRTSGEVCQTDSDCCTEICLDTDNLPCDAGDSCYCVGLEGGGHSCRVVGEVCVQAQDCCSYSCFTDPTGFRFCQFLGGCRPIGELCTASWQCCSNYPDPECPGHLPGTCLLNEGEGLFGRCSHIQGPKPAGEICDDRYPGAHDCCGGDEACLEDVLEVARCLGAGFSDCIVNGDPCSFSEQCCSGLCAPVGGEYVCVGDCLVLLEPCETGEECCSGYCENNTCCLPDDSVCGSDEVCCSGICDDLTSRCGDCLVDGNTCIDDTECCTGNCNADGICGPEACVELGDPCQVGDTCCAGSCEGGFCTLPCIVTGYSCEDDSDCCSNICDPVTDLCAICDSNTAPCTTDDQCCSGYCDPVTDQCADPVECIPTGDACTTDAECCSGFCYENVCMAACLPSGSPCTADADCCSGVCWDPKNPHCL